MQGTRLSANNFLQTSEIRFLVLQLRLKVNHKRSGNLFPFFPNAT